MVEGNEVAVSEVNGSDGKETTEETQGEDVSLDCNLRFLMVDGSEFRFTVPLTSTIREVKQRIIEDKPQELQDSLFDATTPPTPFPARVEEIRVLYFGKFLEDSKTLQQYNFPTGPGEVNTVHLTCRAPPSVLDDVKEKFNKKRSCCCVVQ